MKKIKLTESQYAELKKGVVKESEMSLDELMSHNDYMTDEKFEILRDSLNKGKVVSVAFIKKDGTPRAGVFRKGLSAYQYSDRPKSDAQANVKENNNLMNAIDINAYKKALAETGDAAAAAKKSWRYVTLANVIGFLAGGQFIDMREDNEIMQRYGEEAYNFLTKSMEAAMSRAQQQAENDPEVVGNEPETPEIEPEVVSNDDQPLNEFETAGWSLDGRDDDSLAANEFETAYRWANHFGGGELLANNNIRNGHSFLQALKNGTITIDDLDAVTNGANGQAGDIPFSQTELAKQLIIPYVEQNKGEQPAAISTETPIEEDDAVKAYENASSKVKESLRTLGFGYHGGIEAKGVGRAGNRRDMNEDIAEIRKWNKTLLGENCAEEKLTDEKIEEYFYDEPDDISMSVNKARQEHDFVADAIEYVGGQEEWDLLNDDQKDDVIADMMYDWNRSKSLWENVTKMQNMTRRLK